MAPEAPHSTRVHAGRMPPDIILFDDNDFQARKCAVESSRASVKAAAHHEDVWRHAAGAGMSDGRSASARALSGTGLSGGLMRKYPTSCGERPNSSAIMAETVSPHIRPWHGPIPHLKYDFT